MRAPTGKAVGDAAGDYVGYLSTVSAYLELPVDEQEEVFRRIRAVLPETVDVAMDLWVHLARRRSGD